MDTTITEDDHANYETFRECLSDPVLRALASPCEKPRKKRKDRRKKTDSKRDSKREIDALVEDQENPDHLVRTAKNDENAAEDLAEFVEYLAMLVFPSLPVTLRTLTYAAFQASPSLREAYSLPLSSTTTDQLASAIPPSAIDSLASYSLLPAVPDPTDISHFLNATLEAYIQATTAPPPVWSHTRTNFCEICEREWVPLTYHHLIPRSTHQRCLKRGWHTEDKLNSVAWLCRAFHSFIHRIASNEELAKHWYSVESLRERDDMQSWMQWIGRVRWQKR